MAITPLRIPDRYYGQPIPVAPDMNQVVDKVDELVAAVNAGLATSNAIVGGDKFVRYLSSQTYGVPADALTLDRLDPATILPGVEATVINPHPTPLTATAASTYYRATIVPAGTAGAVQVPAFVGSGDTVPIVWVEVVNNDTFTPLLKSELALGKDVYAGLELRPLLIALVNGIGTGSSTVVTTPAPGQVVLGPTVTGFLPPSAVVGASVTLTGTGFTKATAVLFNGTPASFQLINATTLMAVVPADATTGPVAVTNSAGTGTSTANFEVKAAIAPPTPGDTTPPSVSFTVPAPGATLTPGAQVLLTVIANDNMAVAGLVLTNGATGAVIGQGARNGSTYTFPYTVGAAGPLSLVATATDAAGNSQSATVSVTVGSGTTAPITPDLTAALAISVATLTLGSPVSFTITPGGGTTPYAYEVVATDTDTGQQFTLGTTRTGSWTPTVAGYYSIEASVTDSSVPSKRAQAITRYLRVSQAVNRIPVADAGQDVTVPAGTTSVALMGKATDPDTGDTIVGHSWRQITGPNNAAGLPATTQNVVVSGLAPGTYQFGYIATDNHGGQSVENFVLFTVPAALPVGGEAYMLLGDGQSNLSGLAPISALYTTQFAAVTNPTLTQAFPNFLMWNVANQEFQPLQVGVNEYGLDGAVLAALGATGYEDGFGWEVGLARRLAVEQPGRKVYYVKYGGIPISSSEGLTLARVMGQHHQLYKEQVQNAKAWLVANNLTPRVKGFLFDQFESDAGNGNYATELSAAFTTFLNEGLTEATTRIVVVAADSPAGTPALLQAQTTVVNQDPTNRRLLAMAPEGTYLAKDSTHIDARTMVLAAHKKLYNLLFDATGGDLTISAATTAGGGNAAIDNGQTVDIAAPANTQFLNLRWDAGKDADAATWTSQTTRALAVRQPLAAKRGSFTDKGLGLTNGNQFYYSDRFNCSQLDGMTYVFYVRGMVARTINPIGQSFLYNGDEDTQGAFSVYWDDIKKIVYARVKSQQSPTGNRSAEYYYFKSVPFGGGNCLITVRYNRTRTTNCIRLAVNGLEAGAFTEIAGADKQPAFFLDGILALFGQNLPGNLSLTGTVQAAAAWNYELSDADLNTFTDNILANAPALVAPSAGQNLVVASKAAGISISADNVITTSSTSAANSGWGNTVTAAGQLAANEAGFIEIEFDGTHGAGAATMSTSPGKHVRTADFAVYFTELRNGKVSVAWVAGAGQAGEELSTILVDAGAKLRIERFGTMRSEMRVSTDGTSWQDLHTFATGYAGPLYAEIDVNATVPGAGCVHPRTFNVR